MNSTGLLQAGAWNYLREEITVALECRRPARIGFDFHLDALNLKYYSESMHSNIISYILARISNYCFERSTQEMTEDQTRLHWVSLQTDLTVWRSHLPASFEPYSTAEKANNPFPSLWLVQPWHGRLPLNSPNHSFD